MSTIHCQNIPVPIHADSPAEHEKVAFRLLVVIASFGQKNLDLLKQQISRYQQMDLHVDVVVVSNDEKDLGPTVQTIVGLPIANPWSLPFAHKPVFSENLERYDLFAYSEDDIGVTEENIRAFVDITPHLRSNEIAGFIRYEIDKVGQRSYPDVFGRYHWEVTSPRRRGPHVVAHFTNEHAAFYLLTRQQLRTALESRGFMKAPYAGEYDMLCSAATDPYTGCGFRKVVCISSLDKFSIHHLSNKYAGVVGVPYTALKVQIDTLLEIGKGQRRGAKLFPGFPRRCMQDWTKNYYEPVNEHVIAAIPNSKCSVLSIGTGSGATERVLAERGADVTVFPLDSVIAELMQHSGINVIEGDIEQCFDAIMGRTFDYVVISNLLHLVPESARLLERAVRVLAPGGDMVMYGPNFSSIKTRFKQRMGRWGKSQYQHFCTSDVTEVSPARVRRILRLLGFGAFERRWISEPPRRDWASIAGVLAADAWCLKATRNR